MKLPVGLTIKLKRVEYCQFHIVQLNKPHTQKVALHKYTT